VARVAKEKDFGVVIIPDYYVENFLGKGNNLKKEGGGKRGGDSRNEGREEEEVDFF
jgi:hypothetical protein